MSESFQFRIPEDVMDKPLIDALAERVERLERERGLLRRTNRRWQWVAAALVLGGMVVSAAGAWTGDEPKVVQAEQFILLDRQGHRRGGMVATPGGTVGLLLADGDQKDRIWVTVGENGAAFLTLKDRAGKERFTVGQSPAAGDTMVVQLRDGAGKVRADLALSADGSPGLELRDEAGKTRFAASLLDGAPAVRLSEGEGKTRAYLGLVDGRHPMLSLSDAAGMVRAQLAVLRNDLASIRLTDQKSRPRLEGFVARGGSPHFVLWDEESRSVFAAPEGRIDLRP
jgi:hypothetical protein